MAYPATEQIGEVIEGVAARDLAAAIPDPILLIDANAATRHANPAAIGAFGHLPEGTLVLHRFRTPEMQKLVSTLVHDRREGSAEYVERVPLERAFRVSARPLGGKTGLFLLHFKDQSEARRIDRMRADFIANASHELRTPLASISGFIETLRGPARDDAKAREIFLEIMQQQTSRMARLIDDLLSLSRIEMKPYMRASEKIDLVATVASAVETLGHLTTEYNVQVTLAAPQHPVLVPGSRDELMQVFLNLLENACKYGQDGGRVEITFGHGEGNGAEATVTFRDYGPGIADEHIPRITERFYRVDAESSRVKNGTGLGLAIVKHILTRHDGRLTVKSTLGEGSAFSVHLPVD